MAVSIEYTTPDRLLRDFVARGLVVLSPRSVGVPLDTHARIYEAERAALHAKERITSALIPEVLEVINAPGVVDACNQLVGENWAIQPFTHNTPFASGSHDQHWHKDDNGPYNLRKQRHHRAVQIEMLYYPQDVRLDMGPTATIPYSQYWTFNHEENHDNFAGADHLDFAYQLNGMERLAVSGPRSEYAEDDIRNQSTAHDIRMREAVANTGWPLVQPCELGPLEAGSVVLTSHNLIHRGNHRRDDWRTWKLNPRFMWRFWLYRTTDPHAEIAQEIDWKEPQTDPLTGIDLADVSDDITVVWRYQNHWMQTGKPPPAGLSSSEQALGALNSQLRINNEEAEPQRIGAAYSLATMDDEQGAAEHLGQALHDERESVRRAALYGLIALGEGATREFDKAVRSAAKWVRKAGVFGLGEVAALTPQVLATIVDRLENDPSVYVRSVAAGSLGCLARRAVATGVGVEIVLHIKDALVASLLVEKNRLAMNVAQNRSIKFVRPTDECDVCEGIGIDYGQDRFARVRSAPRENALSALVVVCSHGAVLGDAVDELISLLSKVVATEENVFCVGLAMDALQRLTFANEAAAAKVNMQEVLRSAPLRDWESLTRSGRTVHEPSVS